MKPPYYNITATCTSSFCRGGSFTVRRKSATYKPEGCPTQAKTHVVCPDCRTWADIIDIKKMVQ